MSEQIRILDRSNPSILIFEAMVEGTKREDMLDAFGLRPDGDDTVAQVDMLVNGVLVPVVKTLGHYFKLFDDQVEERAVTAVIAAATTQVDTSAKIEVGLQTVAQIFRATEADVVTSHPATIAGKLRTFDRRICDTSVKCSVNADFSHCCSRSH